MWVCWWQPGWQDNLTLRINREENIRKRSICLCFFGQDIGYEWRVVEMAGFCESVAANPLIANCKEEYKLYGQNGLLLCLQIRND